MDEAIFAKFVADTECQFSRTTLVENYSKFSVSYLSVRIVRVLHPSIFKDTKFFVNDNAAGELSTMKRPKKVHFQVIESKLFQFVQVSY